MTGTDLLAHAAAAAGRNDWTGALKVLQGAPPTNEVLNKRGWYASLAKHYQQAIDDFGLLHTRQPNDHMPLYMIGFQYYQQKEYKEAAAFFKQALERKPDYIKGLWRLAYSLSQLGETTQALLNAGRLMRAWSVLPPSQQDAESRSYARACGLVGRNQRHRDPHGAAKLFAEAVKYEPSDPYVHYHLARVLRITGRYEEALTAIVEADRLKPGDTNINLEYAETLALMNRPDEAMTLVRRASPRCSSWVAVKAAKLAARLEDDDMALSLYTQATRDRAVRADESVQSEYRRLTLLRPPSRRSPSRPSSSTAEQPPPTTHNSDRSESAGTRPRSRSRVHRRPAESSRPEASSVGMVDLVNVERNFGFVLSTDGTRHHFRPSSCPGLQKGDRVTFSPGTAPKGPTALNLRRLHV